MTTSYIREAQKELKAQKALAREAEASALSEANAKAAKDKKQELIDLVKAAELNTNSPIFLALIFSLNLASLGKAAANSSVITIDEYFTALGTPFLSISKCTGFNVIPVFIPLPNPF